MDIEELCCDQCGKQVGLSSHYHCANCGEECSMVGHFDFKKKDFYCVKKDDGNADDPPF